MAANLDMVGGVAAMAYVGATPWHGMGQKLTNDANLDEWRIAAGLAYEVAKHQAFFQIGERFVPVEDAFYLARQDTGACISGKEGVTGRYKIAQPAHVIEFFRDFVKEGGGEDYSVETAGVLDGGRKVWMLAKYNGEFDVAGDAHRAYLLCTTSYDKSIATTGQFTMVRTVCENTLMAGMADKRAVVRIRHSTDFSNALVQEEAVKTLEQAASVIPVYQKAAQSLLKTKLTKRQLGDFFKSMAGIDGAKADAAKRAQGRLSDIEDAYTTTVDLEDTAPNTAWAAFNAITRHVDHTRATRKTNGRGEAESRLLSANFGAGAAMKKKALDTLLALAA